MGTQSLLNKVNHDQIGRFVKFVREKFSLKSSQNICEILGYLERHHFLTTNVVDYFWAPFYSEIWSH